MRPRLLARSVLGLALAGLLVASSAPAGTSAAPARAVPAPAHHTTGQPNAEWLMMGVACGAHSS